MLFDVYFFVLWCYNDKGTDKKSEKFATERNMKIKEIGRKELDKALPLVWDVFCKFEAVDYPENGRQAFRDAIHDEEYLDSLKAYGAFEGKELLGIIATSGTGFVRTITVRS